MKLHFSIEVSCSAMNEASVYERLRNAVFEWQTTEPKVKSVSVVPVPPKPLESPETSSNSSSRQWPKLHKIKENVTPCGVTDGSNFHDAAVWYHAVKQTYLYMCNILGHSPH